MESTLESILEDYKALKQEIFDKQKNNTLGSSSSDAFLSDFWDDVISGEIFVMRKIQSKRLAEEVAATAQASWTWLFNSGQKRVTDWSEKSFITSHENQLKTYRLILRKTTLLWEKTQSVFDLVNGDKATNLRNISSAIYLDPISEENETAELCVASKEVVYKRTVKILYLCQTVVRIVGQFALSRSDSKEIMRLVSQSKLPSERTNFHQLLGNSGEARLMSDRVLTLLNSTVLLNRKHNRVGEPLSRLIRRASSAVQKYELLTISPDNLSSPSVRSLRDETMKLVEEWKEEHECFGDFIVEHGVEVESRASSLDARSPSVPDERKAPPLFYPHAGNYNYEFISENIAHELNLEVLWNGKPKAFGMTELYSENGAFAVAYKFKLPKSQQFTLDTPNGRVAWDVSEIAVKVIKTVNEPDKACDSVKQNCVRIVREMNVWSKLKHENILPLLGLWENFKPNSYTVPVSPWMTNGTLKRYSENELSMLQRLSIMRDIARALEYMHNHEKGDIAHADLKPDNILVKDGSAYLCDFGLSHLHGRSEGFTLEQHGNNRWKAPEMISASIEEKMKFKPTCANDIYSFGLIFLFVIWKDLPWKAHDEAVIYDVRRDRPELSPMADSTRDEVDLNHLQLMEECWRWEPLLRITARLLLENLLQKLIDAEELMAKHVTEKGEGAAKPENVKREYDTTFYLRPPFHKPSLSN